MVANRTSTFERILYADNGYAGARSQVTLIFYRVGLSVVEKDDSDHKEFAR